MIQKDFLIVPFGSKQKGTICSNLAPGTVFERDDHQYVVLDKGQEKTYLDPKWIYVLSLKEARVVAWNHADALIDERDKVIGTAESLTINQA